MLTEANQLETLRQQIEDADYEAGSQSDYLDRGNPNPEQAQRAKELMANASKQSRALRAQLTDLLATLRSQNPQAIEEWVNFHTSLLQTIVNEKESGTMAVTRRNVAKNTLREWEKVRAGEQEYVSINWYFLKDYKEQVRKLHRGPASDGKAWWQFWK
jgi:hypothetical protein